MRKIGMALVFLVSFLLCSCAPTVHPDNGNASVMKLDIKTEIYDLSSCFPDCTMTGGINRFKFHIGDTYLQLYVYEHGLSHTNTDEYEKVTEEGINFYIKTSNFSGHSTLEGGAWTYWANTSTIITFDSGEYFYELHGSTPTGRDSSTTVELALKLLSESPISGLELNGYSFLTGFLKNPIRGFVEVISKDNPSYEGIFVTEDADFQVEGQVRYLASPRERSPDDENARFIVCDTDQGALWAYPGLVDTMN